MTVPLFALGFRAPPASLDVNAAAACLNVDAAATCCRGIASLLSMAWRFASFLAVSSPTLPCTDDELVMLVSGAHGSAIETSPSPSVVSPLEKMEKVETSPWPAPPEDERDASPAEEVGAWDVSSFRTLELEGAGAGSWG